MLASEVMDRSAGLLNDTARTVFTYTVQIPYLNMALDEMQELFEQNNVPLTNAKSDAGVVVIGATTVTLPSDLVEIQELHERLQGSTEEWQPMRRVDFLPQFTTQIESLIYWTWQNQAIKFIGAVTPREIRFNYIAAVITPIALSTSVISVINSKSFLAYRTAALCAEFIGENKERADSLNMDAQLAIDRLLSINTKGRQSIATRRRPFQASYKVRGAL